MKTTARRLLLMLCLVLILNSLSIAQDNTKPFAPVSGQAGKDVVWVPTPENTVEKMLDIAKITSQDFVMDLGSGDGRNVIGAAKRGARALGVEFEQPMVDLSRRRAAEAGVAETANFVQGDMYEADISKASVMLLFLLPHNMTEAFEMSASYISPRSEEHTSELQSLRHLVCRLLLEKKK